MSTVVILQLTDWRGFHFQRGDWGAMAEGGVPSVSAGQGQGGGSGVNWEGFSHWACCACVVTFDLELGQAMEVSR